MNIYQQLAIEFYQKMDDREFIQSAFKIIDKDRKEVPFIFNTTQNKLWDNMADWNVVLKYRKPGISVMVQSIMLSRCIRKKNQNCVVLSFDKESTVRQLERTEWSLKHMPFNLSLARESKNEFKIEATNSKLFIGVAGSKAFGRGDDIDFLHVSELAWWENPEILYGILEALTPKAMVFVESTANGPVNEFARLYRKGKEGKSKWKSHFFPWWIDPELQMETPMHFVHTEEEIQVKAAYNLTDQQLAWRRWKIANMLEPELFPQEYPASDSEAFLVLGDCVFNKRALANYDRLVKDPMLVGELLNVA